MSTLPTHGITEATPSNIPFGAGTWFKGLKYTEGTGWSGTVMGATSGGCSIKITNEIKDLEIDGVIVPVKGLALMAGGGGEAEVNFAELTPDIIKHTALAEKLDENAEGYVEGFDCFQTKDTIEDGDYVENLANNTADRFVVYVVNYPKWRCAEKLSVADSLAVACPHSERAAALSGKEEHGYPPFFAEEKGRGDAGSGEAKLHKPKVERLFALVAERENNAAHYAENVK